jgi:glucose-6-phosphate 1-epimerase
VHRPLLLREPGRQRVIEADGFDELMLWNPGPAKAHALADLPDDDWQRFACVEAVRVNVPVEVAPGETWSGRQGLLATA